MMKKLSILAVATLLATSAFADSTSGSTSGSAAIVAPGQINSPIVQLNTTSPDKIRSDFHGNTAASTGTTFVNPPSAEVCNNAGDALAFQVVGGGASASKGGSESVGCDVRARAINAKAIGKSNSYIDKVLCQDPKNADVFEYEAEDAEANGQKGVRCPDRLRPQWAKDKEAQKNGKVASTYSADPLIAARQKSANVQ